MIYFYTVWYDEESGEMGVDHTSESVAFSDGKNILNLDNGEWSAPTTEEQQKVDEKINYLFKVMCEVGNGKRE